MNLREACQYGAELLAKAGIEESALDAWYLLEFVTGISRSHYLAWPEESLKEEQEQLYREVLQRRSAHIPLQHITGEQEFMGLPFRVNENVLVPRQDTEVLVEKTLEYLKPGMRFLDLCTGSGCILLSLLYFCPQAKGVGADISVKALATARENRDVIAGLADAHKKGSLHAELTESDLFANIEGDFDLIVSNPPYIPSGEISSLMEEVRFHDPLLALDGHEDGLYFYRRIVQESRSFLKPEGYLLFEIGQDQGEAVRTLMETAGFDEIEVCKDLAGHDRVVKGKYPGWREKHV